MLYPQENAARCSARIERFHDEFGKPVIITRFGADAFDGNHTDPPQMFGEEYQRNMIRMQYAELRKNPM